jgi:hypothetical protein
MVPLARNETDERIGAIASVLIFVAVYAACFPALGVALTIAVGWLPAAVAAVLGAHAVRRICRRARRTVASPGRFD